LECGVMGDRPAGAHGQAAAKMWLPQQQHDIQISEDLYLQDTPCRTLTALISPQHFSCSNSAQNTAEACATAPSAAGVGGVQRVADCGAMAHVPGLAAGICWQLQRGMQLQECCCCAVVGVVGKTQLSLCWLGCMCIAGTCI
jgi:hypothetical protein